MSRAIAALGVLVFLMEAACAATAPSPPPPGPPVAPSPVQVADAEPVHAKPAAVPLDRPPPHPIPYADLPSPVAPPPPATPSISTRTLVDLPGWAEEDHLAALRAFQAGCGAAKTPDWKTVCARARLVTAPDDEAARAFFEANFRAEAPSPTGLLTAYYAPEFPAQETPDEIFSAPVRSWLAEAPDDPLLTAPRARIESEPATGALAFMRAEDLFYLQIQGSGVLVFPDGRRVKAVYGGDNGRPFTPVGRVMVQAGLLTPNHLSGEAIRAWLAAHRGPEADAVMDRNERYIFFNLIPDDGREPSGAAGVALTPGRALAVDPAFHPYGDLYWIDAGAPTLTGANPRYRRLALALDTGSAIRGERRADLYLGRGDLAGQEAGRVRHVLSLVRLIPQIPIPNTDIAAPGHETPAPSHPPAGGD